MNERPTPRPFRITRKSVPFLLLHLLPFAVIWLPFEGWMPFVALGTYVVMMFGVTGGYHRYFSHRTFRTGRVVQFLLAACAQLSAQKGVLWWSSHHRHHHAHSDRPTDVHSPKRHGFMWSHMGWILDDEWEDTDMTRVRDLARFPEIVWISERHLLPATAWVLSLIGIGVAIGHPLALPLWGYFLPLVFAWHATFCINSLAHVFGARIYPTRDTSRNSLFLSVLTLGEGWHNNHHFYQRCAAQGWRWYELDVTYGILRVMQALRLVEGVSGPPAHVLAKTIDRQTLLDHDAAEAQRDEESEAWGAVLNRPDTGSTPQRTPLPGVLAPIPADAIAGLQSRVRELTGHAEGVLARVDALSLEWADGEAQRQLDADTGACVLETLEGNRADLAESLTALARSAEELYQELGRSADARLSGLREEVVTVLVAARTHAENLMPASA